MINVHCPRRRTAGSAAFTLIEVLVVLAIVAMLVGILLPTLASARTSARSVTCLSQMKQIGAATLLYAQDHQNQLPRSSHSALAHRVMPWGYALCPYLAGFVYTGPDASWENLFNGLYRCPQDDRRQAWSYGKNVWFELSSAESGDVQGMSAGPTYPTSDQVPQPSATVIYGELATASMGDHLMAHFWRMGGSPEVDATRHGSTSNYVFVDGHAESRRFESTFNLPHGIDLWNPGTAY